MSSSWSQWWKTIGINRSASSHGNDGIPNKSKRRRVSVPGSVGRKKRPSEAESAKLLPELLTTEAAKDLVTDLDAGDALECYLLTRRTYLHYSFAPPPTSGAAGASSSWNETAGGAGASSSQSHEHEPPMEESNQPLIPVQTIAVGVRYRPPPDGKKVPLSLTLEYSPSRAGRDNLHLSVPSLLDNKDDADAREVHWTNEGHIYYTFHISSQEYSTANYVASLTGAVLKDLLITASRYPTLHRRYQPWQVVLDEQQSSGSGTTSEITSEQQPPPTQRILLKSSGDYDFVQFLLNHLAAVGVELSPVLQPTIHRLQLTATSLQRQTLNPQANQEMAEFYLKLYNCVQSIATAVVPQQPTPPPPPSQAPSASPSYSLASDNPMPSTLTLTPTLSSEITSSATAAPTQLHTTAQPSTPEPPHHARRRRQQADDWEQNAENASIDLQNHLEEDGIVVVKKSDETTLLNDGYGEQGDDNNNNNNNNIETEWPSSTPTTGPPTTASPSASPVTFAPTMSRSASPTAPTMSPISHADAAVEAANEAQAAADVAAQDSDNPQQAAQAAKDAATAAQKAATATQLQQAHLRQEALFSPSAGGVAPTISLCLADPIYGIATPNSNHTTTVYLYWDSTYYFTAQVVPPYMRVVSIPAPLPHPTTPYANNGNGFGGSSLTSSLDSVVDWFLAMVLTAFCALTCLVVVQQVLGRKLIPRLYKFQRWFFDPTRSRHYSAADEWYLDEFLEEEEAEVAAAASRLTADTSPRESPPPPNEYILDSNKKSRLGGAAAGNPLRLRKRRHHRKRVGHDRLATVNTTTTTTTTAAATTIHGHGSTIAGGYAAAATSAFDHPAPKSPFAIDDDEEEDEYDDINNSKDDDDDDDDDDEEEAIGGADLGDVELPTLLRPRTWSRMSASSFDSGGGGGGTGDAVYTNDLLIFAEPSAAAAAAAAAAMDRPPCFEKDPELVDLPDLKRSSKVAVPVSVVTLAASAAAASPKPSWSVTTTAQSALSPPPTTIMNRGSTNSSNNHDETTTTYTTPTPFDMAHQA